MCHMFPCFREKPAFPTRDELIDKRNFFLLSGRAVFRCRHKNLQEKKVPTDRENNSQIIVICKNKLSKAELYKSGFAKTIMESNYLYTFQNSPYFLVNIFVIPVYFH